MVVPASSSMSRTVFDFHAETSAALQQELPEDPIYALAQRIPLKQGSLLLWDQLLGLQFRQL